MWSYNYTDELYHHGVKGMKWGVRRNKSEYYTFGKARKKAKAAARDARAQKGAKRKLGGLVEAYPNPVAKFKGKAAGRKVYRKSMRESIAEAKANKYKSEAGVKYNFVDKHVFSKGTRKLIDRYVNSGDSVKSAKAKAYAVSGANTAGIILAYYGAQKLINR